MIPKNLYKLLLKIVSLSFALIFIAFFISCKKIEREPKVITEVVSEITATSAKATGEIIDLGNGIINYGHCWSLSANPTTADSKTSLGSIANTGFFESNMQGLEPGKTYYVKAYVINKDGVLYGADLSFTTLCTAPSATTNSATNISTTTATLNGTVNANSFSTTVTFEYGTTISYGSSITATPSPVTGNTNIAVSVGVTSLSPNTLYHYRVKTINCGGTTYGGDLTFNITWSENFEVYNAGTFPSPTWTADGNAPALSNNYINSSISYEGNKSLQLFGTIGGCWAAIAYHYLNATPTFDIEFAVRNGNEILSGCNPDRAVVGLNKGTIWTNPSQRIFIKFDGDGKVYGGGGKELSLYNNNTWYLVRIRYERISTSEIKLSYWINNNYFGSESLSAISEENLLNNLEIQVLEGSAWFDSIKIIQY